MVGLLIHCKPDFDRSYVRSPLVSVKYIPGRADPIVE